MSSPLDIVKAWEDLISAGKFDEAADLVAEDISTVSPKASSSGKAKWKASVPDSVKNGVKWDAATAGEHDRQIITNGSKKVGLMTVKVKRVIEVNEAGKIQSVIVSKV